MTLDPNAFAHEWIAAWNAHDLPRVLSHYADDFVMSSPFIVRLENEPSGTLHGKAAIAAYWSRALARMPDLRFEHIATCAGAGSVAIHYRGPGGRLSIEVFFFDDSGKVVRAAAHYAD